MDSISDINIDEDNSTSITISANDVDNTLDLAVESSESNINVSLNGSLLTINPEQEFNGFGSITVIATEIGGAELSTSQVFSVNGVV
jgi:hypothetical protein